MTSELEAPSPPRRRVRHCRNCGEIGHDIRQCSKVVEAEVEPLTEAAQLREQLDALLLEVSQYEAVRANVEQRLATDRATIEAIKQRLAQLRDRRQGQLGGL